MQTAARMPVVLQLDGDTLYISVVEHYETIDPTAREPDQRFRTDHFTMDITNDDGTIGLSAVVTSRDLFEAAEHFLTAGREAQLAEALHRGRS